MPTVPIALLLLGALVTWLARRRPERMLWAISLGSAAAAWLAILLLGTRVPSSVSLSVWRPVELYGSRLELSLDPIGWTIGYSALTLLMAVVMTGAAREGETASSVRVMMLTYTALGLAAILPGNLLTVATAWALMDGVAALLLMRMAGGGESRQSLVTRIAVDVTGVVLIVAAAAEDWVAGGEADLGGGPISSGGAALLSLAVLFRLGLMPPHFALPSVPGVRRGLGTLLRLLPPAGALCVLGRGLGATVPQDLEPWLRAAGVLGVVLGAARWALDSDAVMARRFLVLGLVGVGVLAATLPGQSPEAVLSVTGALLLLAGGVVSLGEIHTPAHRVWLGVGALLLAGLPGSIGGRLATVLGSGLVGGGMGWVAAAGVVGIVLLTAGCARAVMAASTAWPSGESLVQMMYGAGLLLPTLAGLGLGLWTRQSLSAIGLIVFLLAVAAGLVDAWRGLRGRKARLTRLDRVVSLADPAPLYRVLWAGYRLLTRWIGVLTAALEGEGAMLWTYVVLVLVVLSLP